MRMVNTIKMVCLFSLMLLLITGCSYESRPVGYYEEQVSATVTRVNKTSWFAGMMRHQAQIWITDNKYGATKMYQSYAAGVFYLPEHWNYEKGDQITVTVRVEYFMDTYEIRRVYIK